MVWVKSPISLSPPRRTARVAASPHEDEDEDAELLRTAASLVLSRDRRLDDDADPWTAARGARRRCGQSGTAERRHRVDAPRSAFSSAALTGAPILGGAGRGHMRQVERQLQT